MAILHVSVHMATEHTELVVLSLGRDVSMHVPMYMPLNFGSARKRKPVPCFSPPDWLLGHSMRKQQTPFLVHPHAEGVDPISLGQCSIYQG